MLKFIYFVVKPNWQRPVILKLWKNVINQFVGHAVYSDHFLGQLGNDWSNIKIKNNIKI
jgi:hypothetical protein